MMPSALQSLSADLAVLGASDTMVSALLGKAGLLKLAVLAPGE